MTYVPSLLDRAKAGDHDAFTSLFAPIIPLIHGVYRKRNGHVSVGRFLEAEDLVQETAERAWQHLHEFDHGTDSGFGGWVVRIARNLYIDWGRTSSTTYTVPLNRFPHHERSKLVAYGRPCEVDPDVVADWPQTRDVLETALECLSPLERTTMRYYLACVMAGAAGGDERAHYRCTAEHLGVPVTTVRMRIHSARSRLRAMFPRRGYSVLHAERADPPVSQRGFPRGRRDYHRHALPA